MISGEAETDRSLRSLSDLQKALIGSSSDQAAGLWPLWTGS
jgi:hypothetical protein